jgi:uncharacterized protein
MTSEGYLRHVHKDGRATIEGYLEDYALVTDGLLNLHQATFTGEWLRQAIRLAQVMIDAFWDESAGTFYDTSGRHQALFIRPRSTHDGALPSGSSAATLALLKVSRLTGHERLEQIAERSLRTVQGLMSRYPLGFGNWLCALDFYLSTPKEIAIVGTRDNPATIELLRVFFNTWLPNKVVAAYDPNDPAPVADLRLLENRRMVNNQPTVYVCERHTCRVPLTEPDLLRNQLRES